MDENRLGAGALLPIGSVVLVKGHEDRMLAVTGYGAVVKNHIYDYCAVPYPGGVLDDRKKTVFDAAAIAQVVAEGMKGSEYEAMCALVESKRAQAEEKLRQKAQEPMLTELE